MLLTLGLRRLHAREPFPARRTSPCAFTANGNVRRVPAGHGDRRGHAGAGRVRRALGAVLQGPKPPRRGPPTALRATLRPAVSECPRHRPEQSERGNAPRLRRMGPRARIRVQRKREFLISA